MTTFIIGLLILLFGYIFYSKYIERIFAPDDRKTPAVSQNDGVDFIPLSLNKNMLIHLLNIAGLGPILGAIQGILFGPTAFILIPLGCVFMGSVHDYFCGMISIRNGGAQITELINKYLGRRFYQIFVVIVSIMLILLSAVFIYTAGDVIAERFFSQTDFSINNPVIVSIYFIIALYYILAAMFPIDKIIGRFYPVFTVMLLLGTLFILAGFFIKGINLTEFSFSNINLHPKGLHILPIFFMTVSCGLLSGFHSTQAVIISRTVENERQGKRIFYGMMCVESLIAMIWAAAAMGVYNQNIVPEGIIGTANVINIIADNFVTPYLAWVVTLAVVILPITSGDTALRALRLTLCDIFKLKQEAVLNRVKIMIPIVVLLVLILWWAKCNSDSFSLIWRYFTFVNQLIAIPTFLYATVYLYREGKNYFVTLIPGLFYIFITSSFILNAKIGFNLPYAVSEIAGVILTILSLYFIVKKYLKKAE